MLLIHFLNNSFKLYYYHNFVLTDNLKIDNIDYIIDSTSKKSQGFLGFFDWLRIDASTIVGIRICYFEHHLYTNALIQFPYVISTFENKCIELKFDKIEYDFDLSGDQDFTNNFVYKSKDNSYLYTFGLDHLTNEELESLKKYCNVM